MHYTPDGLIFTGAVDVSFRSPKQADLFSSLPAVIYGKHYLIARESKTDVANNNPQKKARLEETAAIKELPRLGSIMNVSPGEEPFHKILLKEKALGKELGWKELGQQKASKKPQKEGKLEDEASKELPSLGSIVMGVSTGEEPFQKKMNEGVALAQESRRNDIGQ